jgi:ATP-dependent RNA helicase RhlE
MNRILRRSRLCAAEIIFHMPETKINTTSGFDRFELHEKLMHGIEAAGFTEPRSIQAETIPAGMMGRDVLGLAQTGTGKTAAFALPMLNRILNENKLGPRGLVLAPTRELATQIAEEMRTLSRFAKVHIITIFGGVSASNQIKALRRKPDIIVGCPGRTLDLLRQGELYLDGIDTLVLDEADHMFDMGFLPDIRAIIAALPGGRQNLLFSATMPAEVRKMADKLLKTPLVVELGHSAPATTIDHALILVGETRKRDLLNHVLGRDDCESAIVFTRTKHRARRLAEQLSKSGHRAVSIQGNLSQGQRDRAMRGFRSRQFDVLVATDIVARGIDVNDVSHVINFDVPSTPEAYTHRIGRTGRSEREGMACTFVTGADYGWMRATERMIGKPIQQIQVDGFEADTEAPKPAPRGRDPRRGRAASPSSSGQRSGQRPGRAARNGSQSGEQRSTSSSGGGQGGRRRRR